MDFVKAKQSGLWNQLKKDAKLLLQQDDSNNEFGILFQSLKVEPSFYKWLKKTLPDLIYHGCKHDKELFNKGFQTLCETVHLEYQNSAKILNMLYQMLKLVLEDTIPMVRLYFFHDIVEHYYHMLKEEIEGMNVDFTTIISLPTYERCIKLLIPFVKIEIIKKSFTKYKANDLDQMLTMETLVSELKEYFMCPNLLIEDCYRILESKLNSKDFQLHKYHSDAAVGSTGFIGEYFKLKIYYKYQNRNEILQVFVKFMLSTGQIFGDMAEESFKKEEFFYRTFIPQLHKCGLNSVLNFLPECYFIRSNDCVVLEDLTLAGFSSLDYQNLLQYNELSLIIKQLAKLHACSILFEEEQIKNEQKIYRLNDEYGKYLIDVNFSDEKWGELNKCAARNIYEFFLIKFPEIPKKMTINEFINKVKSLYRGLHEKLSCVYKYRSVICHGDMWLGNIMFKTSANDIFCKLIDFQLIRYCPPALELWFLLYTNTNKEVRLAYSDILFNEYYEELTNIVSSFNSDISKAYSKNHFLESIEVLKISALCLSLGYVALLYCPKNLLPLPSKDSMAETIRFYLEDRSEVYSKALQDECYRIRMKDLLEELYILCEKDVK